MDKEHSISQELNNLQAKIKTLIQSFNKHLTDKIKNLDKQELVFLLIRPIYLLNIIGFNDKCSQQKIKQT